MDSFFPVLGFGMFLGFLLSVLFLAKRMPDCICEKDEKPLGKKRVKKATSNLNQRKKRL